MSRLTIYKDNISDATIVSNQFIDEYMKDANDAQIKIYLYLLRMMNSNLPTSISDIADKFNHTEKDVLRALTYWEKQNLLRLDFDDKGEVCGLHLQSPQHRNTPEARILPMAKPVVVDGGQAAASWQPQAQPSSGSTQPQAPARNVQPQAPSRSVQPQTKSAPVTQGNARTAQVCPKPSYSLDEIAASKQDETISQILFIAESYLGRTLSVTDIQSLLYIYKELHFSTDLIDYLIEYCVGRGKREMRYIEKVAVNWASENVTTVRQAKNRATRYDKLVYTVMKALGRQSDPTQKEADYIQKWYKQYGFSQEMILAACEKTVLAVDSHRFEYTEGILSKWHSAGIRTLRDVQSAEESFQKAKTQKTGAGRKEPSRPSGSFYDFEQREYDFKELEKELISN